MIKLVDRLELIKLRKPLAYIAIGTGVFSSLFGPIIYDACEERLNEITSLIANTKIINYQNYNRTPR